LFDETVTVVGEPQVPVCRACLRVSPLVSRVMFLLALSPGFSITQHPPLVDPGCFFFPGHLNQCSLRYCSEAALFSPPTRRLSCSKAQLRFFPVGSSGSRFLVQTLTFFPPSGLFNPQNLLPLSPCGFQPWWVPPFTGFPVAAGSLFFFGGWATAMLKSFLSFRWTGLFFFFFFCGMFAMVRFNPPFLRLPLVFSP